MQDRIQKYSSTCIFVTGMCTTGTTEAWHLHISSCIKNDEVTVWMGGLSSDYFLNTPDSKNVVVLQQVPT
jgi:hypothetical protein